MTYAGFSNRETWAAHHWVVSEADYLRAIREVIRLCPEDTLEYTVLAVIRLAGAESPYVGGDLGDVNRINVAEVIAKIREGMSDGQES